MTAARDLARLADAVEALTAELRAHRANGSRPSALASRRARAPGRARLPAAEAARRAAASAGEVDEVTRARVARAMGRSGAK